MSPAVAPAKVAREIQGIRSSVDDIVLRDGEGLRQRIGGAVLPTPVLRRGMGNSTIEIDIHDPKMRWLRKSLAAEKWDVEIDGLRFRYLGTSKSGKKLTLRFEDLHVALLREVMGPKKVYRRYGKPDEVTRAEFIVALVKEALPGIKVFCPELHKRPPIETRQQGKQAQEAAATNREPGIGDVRGLTAKGLKATQEQINIGDRAIRTAESHDAPPSVILAVLISLIVESVLGQASSNYMQMTPETAGASKYSPTVLEEAVTGFLKGYVTGHEGALSYARKNPEAKPYEIAQAVQRSGAGASTNGAGNYGPWVDEAREWYDAFGGSGGGSGAVESSVPYAFEVEEKEDYWKAIQRLADEVNWRAFFVGGRFFYISETELARSQVRLAIELHDNGEITPGRIEDVDFDYNENKLSSTATITAPVKDWGVPPGAVLTLAGFGPASIGFGSAPVKADKKGQLRGISSNRNAVTGEGKGRYVVSSIEVPIEGDDEVRLATITARRPTPPRPEPAAETRTTSAAGDEEAGGGFVGAPDEKVQAVLDYCERSIGRPYVWGSYDCSAFVSFALEAGGFLDGRLTTSGFVSWGEAGEGEFITVHDKAGTGNPKTEHVIIEVLGEFFECGGISGGVGRPDYSASALAEFSTKRHPPGY